MVEYRSVSQLKEYLPKYKGCPYRYYLHRVERAWERPAAWLPQGTAVHEAGEMWERSGRRMPLRRDDDPGWDGPSAEEVFRKAYAEGTDKLLADTPNMEYWFRSGPYAGEDDIARRFEIGLGQVEKYVSYYTEKHPEEVIWITPDGTPAIELELSAKLGDVEVRGFVDAVVVEEDGKPTVRDTKTGNSPGDAVQLKTYGVMIEQTTGVPMERGDYLMLKTGKPTIHYDLTEITDQELVDEFGEMDRGVRAGEFDPAPDPDKCNFCSVALSCSFRAF